MAAPALALLASTILFNSTAFPPTSTCVTSCEGSANLRGPLCETGCTRFAVCHAQTLYTHSCPPDEAYDADQGLCRPQGAVECRVTSLRVKRQTLGETINNLLRGLVTNLKNQVTQFLSSSVRNLVREGFNSIIHSLLGVCLTGDCPTPSPASVSQVQKLEELNLLTEVFKLPINVEQLLSLTGLMETEAQRMSLVNILTEMRNLLEDFLVRQVEKLVDAGFNALFGPSGLVPLLPGSTTTAALTSNSDRVTPMQASLVEGVAGALLQQGAELSPLDQNTNINDVAPKVQNLFGLLGTAQEPKPFFLGPVARGVFEFLQGAGLASAAVLAANDVAYAFFPPGNSTLNATDIPTVTPNAIFNATTAATMAPFFLGPVVRSIMEAARTAGIVSAVILTLNDIAYGLFGGLFPSSNATTTAATPAPQPTTLATAATGAPTANTATANTATANTATAATANTATANTATGATANTATANTATANTATANTATPATGAAVSTAAGATAKPCAVACRFSLFQEFFNYCGDCRYYVECIQGNRFIRPCAADTQWDSRLNRCVYRSTTCPQTK